MALKRLAGLLVLVLCVMLRPVHAEFTFTSQEKAYAACEADLANDDTVHYATDHGCDEGAAPSGRPSFLLEGEWNPGIIAYYSWSGTYTAPPSCSAGYVPPVGSTLSKYSDGTRCYSGCEMDRNLVTGSSHFGQMEEDGSTCPVESGSPTDESNSWTPGDTTNPDGSRTSCDSNGNCVTYKPSSDSPAAASSASGDHSTASNSTTTNPASSSSSTTTYNSGDSSGSDSGSGDGTGVVSSSTKTDTPASTSSTSSKCTTGVCDVGDADGVVGSLYTPGSDTPSSVFNEFKSEVSSAPITQAVSGFFSLTASSSCPTWTIPGNKYWGEAGFTFDFFCQSAILALLQYAGYIVLAVAAYAAFKIAIY